MPLNLKPLLSACASMSLSKTGALLIISRNTKLGSYESTGELMNARLSSSLIESVFFKNNPLHDGAVILNRNRIAAARCILPVSETVGLPLHMGLRHRSAATLTEMTDALAIVVSEETGNIAYLKQGRLSELKNVEELEDLLIRDLNKH
jgi:DNA integrity scanning protein DisA with diadenylate cyclase activity